MIGINDEVPLFYEFKVQLVNLAISSVIMEYAFLKTWYVIGSLIVLMVQTKRKHYVPLVLSNFSALMADVKIWKMFVTELTTVKITVTKIRFVSVSYSNLNGLASV